MRTVLLWGLIVLGTVFLSGSGAEAQFESGEPVTSENLEPPLPPPIPLPPGVQTLPPPPIGGVNGTVRDAAAQAADETAGQSQTSVQTSGPPAEPVSQPPAASSPIIAPPAAAAGPPQPRSAGPAVPVPAKSDFFAGFDGSSMNLIKAAGAFILVLALLLIFLKLLSRVVKGRSFRGDQTFTLRGTLALDSRRYLAAVEVDGQLLVVGVTQDRLTALGQWPLLEEDEPFRDLPPQPFTEPEEVRPAKRPPKTPPGKKPKPAPAPPEIFEKQLQPAQPVLPVQAAQAARAVQPTEPIQTIETPPPAEPVQPVQPVRFRQPPAPAVPAAVPDLVRLDESLKTESVRLPEPIELEPLTILDQRLSSPVSGREDDSLSDFTLTLEDEPFTGPEANDEFLDLDLDVPPDRRR